MAKRKMTHSSMTCAKNCLMRYFFRTVVGLVKQRDETPRKVGSIFHKGTERLGDPKYKKLKKLEAKIKFVLPAFAPYPGWCTEEEDQRKWDYDYAIARGMLRAYLQYWENDAVEIEKAELEFELSVVNPETGMPSRRFVRAGVIDMLARIPDGRLLVGERKTTTSNLEIDGDYWKKLRLDQQISMYVLAARDMEEDIDSSAVLYDVTRRPMFKGKAIPVLDKDGKKNYIDDETGEIVRNKDDSPRQSGKPGTTLKSRPETRGELEARVYEAMTEDPDSHFCRREIPRLESDLEDFAKELWQQAGLLGECHKKDIWFRNTDACMGFFTCDYFEVCHEGTRISREYPPLGFEFKRAHSELAAKTGE